jgi:hypothetical protein
MPKGGSRASCSTRSGCRPARQSQGPRRYVLDEPGLTEVLAPRENLVDQEAEALRNRGGRPGAIPEPEKNEQVVAVQFHCWRKGDGGPPAVSPFPREW